MMNSIISNQFLNRLTFATVNLRSGFLRFVSIYFIFLLSLSLYGINQIIKQIIFRNRRLS